MRRLRLASAVLAALVLAVALALLTTGSSAAPSRSQVFFKKTLLEDPKTTSAVKNLLRDGGGIVAPDIEFDDVTGDERLDAIVLVDTGGVAGTVALYVFSTDDKAKGSALRAVYRSQRLYRASAEIADGRLVVRTPRFRAGDDVCCPARVVERVYAWSARDRTLRLRSSDEMAGPTG